MPAERVGRPAETERVRTTEAIVMYEVAPKVLRLMKGQERCGRTLGLEATVTLLSLIVTIVVVGVILWLINTYIPMQGTVKSILNAVVVIVLIIWLLNAFGLLGPLNRPIR
jgi:hypothetical protein